MTLEILFALSGVIVASLIYAKVWEERRKEKPAILRLISQGDEQARFFAHELAHRYVEVKNDADILINRELPLRLKNFIQKTNSVVKERADKYIGDIRQSRFLKKSDGLSDFFKNLSEKENGGRIDESLEESTTFEG